MKKLTMVLVCLTLAMLVQAAPAAAQSTTTKQAPKTSTTKTPASSTAKTKTGPTTKKPAPATAVTLTDQKSKLSYALGMNLGTNLRLQGVEVDPNVLTQAIKDGLSNSKTLMTEDEARNTLMQWQTEMRTKQEEKRQQAS